MPMDFDLDGLGVEFFARVQNVWKPFAGQYKVIPFCTPVFERPTALVIGTNHSTFSKRNQLEALAIAERYSSQVPSDNTFLEHDHDFARGLRRVCQDAGLHIDRWWMGTNRCALQTGPHGLKEIQALPGFRECQDAMDELLRELISVLRPVNVILAGSSAVQLFYPGKNIREAEPLTLFPQNSLSTRLIPIHHPSMGYNRKPATARVKEWFVLPSRPG